MSSPLSTVAQFPLPLLVPPSPSPTPASPALSLATSDSPAPLASNPQLDRLVTTILPASAALLAVAFELFSRIRYPKAVRNVACKFSRPFRNFFTLADLEAPVPCPLHQAPWKARVLVLGSAVQSVGWLAVLAYKQEVADWAGSVRAGVAFLAWTFALTRVLARPPVTPPYLLLGFFVTCVAAACYDLVLGVLREGEGLRYAALGLGALQLCVLGGLVWTAGTYPLGRHWPGPNVARPLEPPSSKCTMPEDSADLWSWSTFSFVEPLFEVSNARTVNDTDVWALSPFFTHKNIFRKYLQYVSEHPTYSLLRYLIVSNSLDLIIVILLETWSAVMGYVPPYALQRILQALSDPSPDAKKTAYFFAVIAFMANLSFAQVDVNKGWALKRRDVSGKNAGKDDDPLLEKEDDSNADLGKIVNLMQGDAYAVAHRFWQFSGFFLAPVRLTIALVFLHRVLGWSAFTAVAVTVVVYLLNYPLAKYDLYLMRQCWKATDRRINTVNELFQNIRFLKFYGWEFRWSERVKKTRESELQWRVKANIVDTFISFMWGWMPSATAVATFVCYTVVAGEPLTVATAFTALSLFSHLQGPMVEFPDQVFAMLHAYISMQRIEKFLNEEEVPDWASSLKRDAKPASTNDVEIGFENASFEWDIAKTESPSRFTLGPLDIRFPPGKLSLVSGPTGSGKSALLVAMLGGHEVAYCAQNPWLQHATIRHNIIFGAGYGYDEARYRAVVDACALAKDFEIFPAGDKTEIGEKGITLSGGQRARIALARALYSPAKVVLLDDPLAAVDSHTATHLVKRALSGDLARGRTIILVTHHINLCLPIAAYLVELSSGAPLRSGLTSDLRERGELEKLVDAEDSVEEDHTEDESSSTDVENEADNTAAKKPTNGNANGNGVGILNGKPQEPDAGKLIDEEARAEGRVSLRTYWTYIKAAGIVCWIFTFAFMLLIRFIQVGQQVGAAAPLRGCAN
uniref:Trehalase ) n=1 Tax=Ganoderma boninense TaxID=34458 RepID=A0A5K1K3D9_9APHY|nr:Trehalase (EC (Alpha-trehalose glucohydrolase) [Ganoderma boninense]